MPKNKSLYIFDMDGTLIDSSQAIIHAINFVRDNMALSPLEDSYILEGINDERINPAQYFYGIERFEPIHEEWFAHYYTLHHDKEIALYEGIGDMLEALKSKDVQLAIATNAYRTTAVESLKHTGIYEFFDAIVTADDVNKVGKPHPDMLLRLLDTLSILPHASIFVGDSHKDRVAAQKASIDFLMVNWGFGNHDEGAIETPTKLYEILI